MNNEIKFIPGPKASTTALRQEVTEEIVAVRAFIINHCRRHYRPHPLLQELALVSKNQFMMQTYPIIATMATATAALSLFLLILP